MVELTREQLLREEFHKQTARISWHDLQVHYAAGNVVRVGDETDLVNVAVQLGMDNTAQFEQWIADGEVAPVTDEDARRWYGSNQMMWAVVSPPWVLIQLDNSGRVSE